LRLEPLQAHHLEGLLAVKRDPRVTAFLPYAAWQSIKDAELWYARMQDMIASGSGLVWVIVDAASNTPLGDCLLFRFEPSAQRAELGYVLGYESWNKGIATEALSALIQAAFTDLKLRRLEAQVQPSNAASIRVLEKLGFEREGLMRERWVNAVSGLAYDVVVFGLLR
jgi:[ribosomal protein S5]-alanine N-acetyltransferase